MRRTAWAATSVIGLAVVAADARPPAAWVTVTGRVVLPAGVPVPGRKFLPGFPAVPDESVLVDAKTRGVRNVVVWLRPDNTDPKARLAAAEIHPDDANRVPRTVPIVFTPQRVFAPHVTAARVGDTLQVVNQAAGPTNFLWDSGNNGRFNPVINSGQAFKFPAPLAPETAPIAYTSNLVPTGGIVRVFEHPYHAVTDAEGKFELKDAPAGKYRLVYWHETQGFKGGRDGRFGEPVEIGPGEDGTTALLPVRFDVTR